MGSLNPPSWKGKGLHLSLHYNQQWHQGNLGKLHAKATRKADDINKFTPFARFSIRFKDSPLLFQGENTVEKRRGSFSHLSLGSLSDVRLWFRSSFSESLPSGVLGVWDPLSCFRMRKLLFTLGGMRLENLRNREKNASGSENNHQYSPCIKLFLDEAPTHLSTIETKPIAR